MVSHFEGGRDCVWGFEEFKGLTKFMFHMKHKITF